MRPRGGVHLFGRKRAAIAIRQKSTPSHDPVTVADISNLQQELKALQQLIREQQSQSYHVESLTRSVSQQSAQLELRLESIESHVSKIGAVETIVTGLRDFLQQNPAIRRLLENLGPVVNRGTPFVRQHKYAILGTLATIVVVWKYRAAMFYQRTSEEVADLARRTLEQDSLKQSIQDTLQTVANNPSTLKTLNDLTQELINHEQTQKDLVNLVVHAVDTPEVQKALMDLLQMVFEDPYLQQLTGEFLLKGLDVESVKEMLDAQTAELVRDTVLDDSVQKATAVGAQRTFWYLITPPFLWRFMGGKKENDDNRTVAGSEPNRSNDEKESAIRYQQENEGATSSLPSQ